MTDTKTFEVYTISSTGLNLLDDKCTESDIMSNYFKLGETLISRERDSKTNRFRFVPKLVHPKKIQFETPTNKLILALRSYKPYIFSFSRYSQEDFLDDLYKSKALSTGYFPKRLLTTWFDCPSYNSECRLIKYSVNQEYVYLLDVRKVYSRKFATYTYEPITQYIHF